MAISEKGSDKEAPKFPLEDESETRAEGPVKDGSVQLGPTGAGRDEGGSGYDPNLPGITDPLTYQPGATEAFRNTMREFDKETRRAAEEAKKFADKRKETSQTVQDIVGEDAVNGMTPDQTLRYSRLADALNSQDWSFWRGGSVDATGRGQNQSGGLESISAKDVDTAEKRAQERAEELSKEKSQQTLGRQDAYRRYDYDIDKLRQQTRMGLSSQGSQIQLQAFQTMLSNAAQQDLTQFNDKEQLAKIQTFVNYIVNNVDEQSRAIFGQLVGFQFPYSNLQTLQSNLFQELKVRWDRATSAEERQEILAEWQSLEQVWAGYQAGLSMARARGAYSGGTQTMKQ